MPRFSLRRRLALRVTATVLAGLYALLASVGDGLHALAHLAESHAAGAAAVAEDCEGCCCHAGHCHDAPPAEAAPSPGDEATVARFWPPGDEPTEPHPHDCAVCQLLAQLKNAATGLAASTTVVWAPAPAPPRSDAKVPSVSPIVASARGPPAAASTIAS